MVYEIRSQDGMLAVVRDSESGELFELPVKARYNGAIPEVYRTSDICKAHEVWRRFGGSTGKLRIIKADE